MIVALRSNKYLSIPPPMTTKARYLPEVAVGDFKMQRRSEKENEGKRTYETDTWQRTTTEHGSVVSATVLNDRCAKK